MRFMTTMAMQWRTCLMADIYHLEAFVTDIEDGRCGEGGQ